MTEHNMRFWNAVQKTNPANTKKTEHGAKLTAIDAYSQIQAATELFGPAGLGWGWSTERVDYLQNDTVAVLIKVWYENKKQTVEQWGQCSLYQGKDNNRWPDNDCIKKAETDGITKCLSYIGFNADVFLGKFEDNKYLAEITKEFHDEDVKNAAQLWCTVQSAIFAKQTNPAALHEWATENKKALEKLHREHPRMHGDLMAGHTARIDALEKAGSDYVDGQMTDGVEDQKSVY